VSKTYEADITLQQKLVNYITQFFRDTIEDMGKTNLIEAGYLLKSEKNKLMIAKGLVYAVGIHAYFNYSLEQGNINNVLWLIGISLIYLVYLYRKRSGYIKLIYKRSKMSHMRDRDKDVVLELLGLWFKEGKYMKVIETSKRLLKKDPNNTLVRLFLNKAIDNQRFIDAYTAIRNLFVPKNYMEGLDEEKDTKDLKNN